MTNFNHTIFTLTTAATRFRGMKAFYEKKNRVLMVAPLNVIKQMKDHEILEMEHIAMYRKDLKEELLTNSISQSQRLYREDEIKLIDIQSVWASQLVSGINARIKELLKPDGVSK